MPLVNQSYGDLLAFLFIIVLMAGCFAAFVLGMLSVVEGIFDTARCAYKWLTAEPEPTVPEEVEEQPYNVVDGYVLPTQDDITHAAVVMNLDFDRYEFEYGRDRFLVDFDGEVYFNGFYVGNSLEYLDAVEEIHRERAEIELERLMRVE